MIGSTRRCAVLAGMLSMLPLASHQLLAQDAQQQRQDEQQLVKACNRFGEDLYGKLAANGDPTFSPGSIAMTLVMLLPGARGETADQIAKALRLPKELRGARLLRAAGQLIAASAKRRDGGQPSMRITNDLWAQADYQLQTRYTDALTQHLSANAHSVRFEQDPASARLRINKYIGEATNHRIDDLLAPGSIDSLTRVVLTNAIWFKDAWGKRFSAAATKTQPFTLASGRKTDVPMMHLTSGFRFAENDAWTAVAMPFAHSSLQFEAIVPTDTAQLAAAERALLRGEHVAQLAPHRVAVRLPRFRANASHSVDAALQQLGMISAFDASADFRGIESKGELFVSSIAHKVWIDAHEEGAEAAAATAAVLGVKSAVRPNAEPKRFDADRPFVFGLRDRQTGMLWFVGRVDNPSTQH